MGGGGVLVSGVRITNQPINDEQFKSYSFKSPDDSDNE
jgi:hypothetical protein